MSELEDVLAIPHWINGHAFLSMAPSLLDVCDARSGIVKRRVPLGGDVEAGAAIDAACAALPDWAASHVSRRVALLASLADALSDYAQHFAALIVEETGQDTAQAAREVSEAVAVLRAAGSSHAATTGSGVVAIVSDQCAPLSGPVRGAVPDLLGGATIVLKPSPKAPSAAFALAELSARCDFPDGVFNLLQGDIAAIEGLCAAAPLNLVRFTGDRVRAARVRAIATRYGKPFLD